MSRTFRRWCECECKGYCVVFNLYSVVAGLTGCLTNLNVVGSRRRLYQGTDKDRVNNVSSLGHPAKVGPFDWAATSLDCTVAWPCNSAMVTLLLCALVSSRLLRFLGEG
jgi:hypothetical protein